MSTWTFTLDFTLTKWKNVELLTLSPDQHLSPCYWRQPHHAWVSSHATSGRTTSGSTWFGLHGRNTLSTRLAVRGLAASLRSGTHIWGPWPKLDHYPHCEPLFLNHSTSAVTFILSPWHNAFKTRQSMVAASSMLQFFFSVTFPIENCWGNVEGSLWWKKSWLLI